MKNENDETALDLVPSLRDLVDLGELDARNLTVALEATERGEVRVIDRHRIHIYDGKKFAEWQVESLRQLCRGDKSPPADINQYPVPYCIYFYFIERQLLTACQAQGDRTDQEMESIYSALRRRPDGRSLGVTHDFLWQVTALTLGKHLLSQAELEALMGQLERSVRHWALRPVSRNYAQYLREALLAAD